MTKSRGVRGAASGCAVASLLYLLARSLLTLGISALMGLAHPGASLAKPLGFSSVSAELLQRVSAAVVYAASGCAYCCCRSS